MLSNFTWWQFFGTFLLLCAIYYLLILWMYYKPELQNFLKKLTAGTPVSDETSTDYEEPKVLSAEATTPETANSDSDKIFTVLQADVRSGIKAARDADADKRQIIALIKNVLLKYPELKHPGVQVKINEMLIQECGRAGYAMYPAEAYALWPVTA